MCGVDEGCQLISKDSKLYFQVISPGILFVLVQVERSLEQEEILRRIALCMAQVRDLECHACLERLLL